MLDAAIATEPVRPPTDRVLPNEARSAGPRATGSPPTAAAGGRWWWVWLIVLAVATGAGWLVWHRLSAARAAADEKKEMMHAVRAVPVLTATARRGDLDIYLNGTGTVTPLNTVSVRPRVDGAIVAVKFAEGQHVKVNDVLFEIDARPYAATLAQAKGQLVKDQAAKASADWNVRQDAEAIESHAIAQQQLHTDTATRDSAAGAIAVDEANMTSAQLNVDYCHVTSPIDGRIGLRGVDLGNIVHAADATSLAVVTQLRPITVIFTIVEDDLNRLRRRQDAGGAIDVEAYNRDRTVKVATGTLLAVDNQVDPTTGMVRIRAQFDNAGDRLSPGQFVNARLLVDTVRDAVLVPEQAVQKDADGHPFVYVVVPDTHPRPAVDRGGAKAGGGKPADSSPPLIVKMVPVTVGTTQKVVSTTADGGEDTTVITAGVDAGDRVVTDGVDKLADGSAVSLRRSTPTTRPTGKPTSGPTTRRGRRKAE